MFVVGLDIGYSNLKLAFGEKGEHPEVKVLPVGASPAELMPRQLLTGGTVESIQVTIDDEKWVAGVEPDKLQGWERELHGDYPSTKAYKALFYAGLLLSGKQEIDVLVTGLPVSQYMDSERRKALEERLVGKHKVAPKREINIKQVLVVPQPAGAYMDIVNTTDDEDFLEVMSEGRTVVIDPGFFSVDWVALEEGEVRSRSSGTSLKAMSMLIHETNLLIQEQYGIGPGVEKLEKAIRSEKMSVLIHGEKVDVTDYFETAKSKVAPNALTPMRKSMREDGMAADTVLLAGGGAEAYKEAAEELFPKSKVIVSKNSVAANARGFWYCG